MSLIEEDNLRTSEFLEEAFKFWYNDNHHIRSPFPNYIHNQLREESTVKFLDWLNNVHPEAKAEFSDEVIAEKFEEILFDLALKMVNTEDEKISILYPFLPRQGDKLKDNNHVENVITNRFIKKEVDNNYLFLSCINQETNVKWETSMVLPA